MTSTSVDHRGPFAKARRSAAAAPAPAESGSGSGAPSSARSHDHFLAEMEATMEQISKNTRQPERTRGVKTAAGVEVRKPVSDAYVQRIAAAAEAYRSKTRQQEPPSAPTAIKTKLTSRTSKVRPTTMSTRSSPTPSYVLTTTSGNEQVVESQEEGAGKEADGVVRNWSAPVTDLARLALATDSSSESLGDVASTPEVSVIEHQVAPRTLMEEPRVSPLRNPPVTQAPASLPHSLPRITLDRTGRYLLVEDVENAYRATKEAIRSTLFTI